MTPLCIEDKKGGANYIVPCGRCPQCTARRISAWSFRLMQEDKKAISSYFITLTYATENMPITQRGFMELRKRDIQLFFKRLRKASNGKNVSKARMVPGYMPAAKQIKYYAVGEYGGKTMRPHYHVILFNCDIQLIQGSWNLGHVHYGTVSAASIGYSLKYISKPKRIPLHKNDDRQKEFALMSKGLGKNYITQAMKAWHIADLENRMYCNIEDGKKITMPRYFKDRIYNEDQRAVIAAAAVLRMGEEIEKFNSDPEFEKNYSQREQRVVAAFKRSSYTAKKGDIL